LEARLLRGGGRRRNRINIFYKIKIIEIINMETTINRITYNPDVCHGEPTIRNMRYTVDMVLDLLSSGMSAHEIISDYPAIEENDILACLAFASQVTKVKTINQLIV
jgi:uncharacterized protein (DUF433 family)